uniref:CARD domain-containing protein n=1 Tax=Paramormyrops kingsleyae TaxID=1676925 RepID=A0A3B3T218_9TELE
MDSWDLTEEEMADMKKEVIERLRPYLCDKLIADRHLDYLRSKKIISREDAEEIACRAGNRRKTGKMLDYVAENPRGLDSLVESIRKVRTKDFVILKITSEVEEVKSERRWGAVLAKGFGPPSPCTKASRMFSMWSDSSASFENEKDPPGTLMSNLDAWSGPCCRSSGTLSSSSHLPKPGEPGAPELPEQGSSEAESPGAGPLDAGHLLQSRASLSR